MSSWWRPCSGPTESRGGENHREASQTACDQAAVVLERRSTEATHTWEKVLAGRCPSPRRTRRSLTSFQLPCCRQKTKEKFVPDLLENEGEKMESFVLALRGDDAAPGVMLLIPRVLTRTFPRATTTTPWHRKTLRRIQRTSWSDFCKERRRSGGIK